MQNSLISVIVPVYKTEMYLERCIESIISQSHRTLQIILVEDGSPDNCGAICDNYALTDERITVIHKVNGGLSSARNAGLNIAVGDYIGFVDSDDYIEPNMYECLLNQIFPQTSQIACCVSRRLRPDSTESELKQDKFAVQRFDRVNALIELLLNKTITNSFCDKLFSADIFNEVRFDENLIYEDLEAMPRCINNSRQVVWINAPLYIYYMSQDSISRSRFSSKQFDLLKASEARIRQYQCFAPELLEQAQASHVKLCLEMIHKSKDNAESVLLRNDAIARALKIATHIHYQHLDAKSILKIVALRISPSLFTLIMGIHSTVFAIKNRLMRVLGNGA